MNDAKQKYYKHKLLLFIKSDSDMYVYWEEEVHDDDAHCFISWLKDRCIEVSKVEYLSHQARLSLYSLKRDLSDKYMSLKDAAKLLSYLNTINSSLSQIEESTKGETQ